MPLLYREAIRTEAVDGTLRSDPHALSLLNRRLTLQAHREGLAYLPIADPLWDINIQLVCRLAFVDSRPVLTLLASWRDAACRPNLAKPWSCELSNPHPRRKLNDRVRQQHGAVNSMRILISPLMRL